MSNFCKFPFLQISCLRLDQLQIVLSLSRRESEVEQGEEEEEWGKEKMTVQLPVAPRMKQQLSGNTDYPGISMKLTGLTVWLFFLNIAIFRHKNKNLMHIINIMIHILFYCYICVYIWKLYNQAKDSKTHVLVISFSSTMLIIIQMFCFISGT